mmetsp:Transcript_12370/g.37737  ORF Transcript_12370/g.37737 Transcript_12370/m.37737 type:complete len:471 (-) Transcript_12370:31-1443(-)
MEKAEPKKAVRKAAKALYLKPLSMSPIDDGSEMGSMRNNSTRRNTAETLFSPTRRTLTQSTESMGRSCSGRISSSIESTATFTSVETVDHGFRPVVDLSQMEDCNTFGKETPAKTLAQATKRGEDEDELREALMRWRERQGSKGPSHGSPSLSSFGRALSMMSPKKRDQKGSFSPKQVSDSELKFASLLADSRDEEGEKEVRSSQPKRQREKVVSKLRLSELQEGMKPLIRTPRNLSARHVSQNEAALFEVEPTSASDKLRCDSPVTPRSSNSKTELSRSGSLREKGSELVRQASKELGQVVAGLARTLSRSSSTKTASRTASFSSARGDFMHFDPTDNTTEDEADELIVESWSVESHSPARKAAQRRTNPIASLRTENLRKLLTSSGSLYERSRSAGQSPQHRVCRAHSLRPGSDQLQPPPQGQAPKRERGEISVGPAPEPRRELFKSAELKRALALFEAGSSNSGNEH